MSLTLLITFAIAYGIGILWCGRAMYAQMEDAAGRRDRYLRESRKYGPQHNYSVRMRNEAKAEHRNVQGWAVALILSPLWPVHALVWASIEGYWALKRFRSTLKWKD